MKFEETTHMELNVSIKKELCTIFINKLHVCNLWLKQFLFSVNFNSWLLPAFQKWPFNWVESFTSLRCDMMTSVVVTCSYMWATLVCVLGQQYPNNHYLHNSPLFFPKEARYEDCNSPPSTQKKDKVIKHETTGPQRTLPGNNNQNLIFILHD